MHIYIYIYVPTNMHRCHEAMVETICFRVVLSRAGLYTLSTGFQV